VKDAGVSSRRFGVPSGKTSHAAGFLTCGARPLLLRRLYALGRMVDVLLYNLGRIHDLWPILLDHLMELLADAKPAVRAAAVDAAGRALAGALAGCIRANEQVRGAAHPAPPALHSMHASMHLLKCPCGLQQGRWPGGQGSAPPKRSGQQPAFYAVLARTR
jgi:hypothetical protein